MRRSALRTAFSLLLSLSSVMLCAGQTPATAQYEGLPGVALYQNGYLLSWDNPKFSQVTVYGRDTQPAYSLAEHRDGTFNAAWAVDSDGVAAVVYNTRQTWEGRLDLLDLTGKLTRTINTGSYIPRHVVFAPDHTIWTVGFHGADDGSLDFNVLHHYARTGEELGQALLWSQIASEHNSYTALQSIHGARHLYTANDRIGFLSQSHYGHSTWIEVSFSGVLLGKYDLGTDQELSYWPVAMTAAGTVYAAIYTDNGLAGHAALDRSNEAWRKIAGSPEGKIIGSDGKNVVFSQRDGATTVLQFVPSASLRFDGPQEAATGSTSAFIQWWSLAHY